MATGKIRTYGEVLHENAQKSYWANVEKQLDEVRPELREEFMAIAKDAFKRAALEIAIELNADYQYNGKQLVIKFYEPGAL